MKEKPAETGNGLKGAGRWRVITLTILSRPELCNLFLCISRRHSIEPRTRRTAKGRTGGRKAFIWAFSGVFTPQPFFTRSMTGHEGILIPKPSTPGQGFAESTLCKTNSQPFLSWPPATTLSLWGKDNPLRHHNHHLPKLTSGEGVDGWAEHTSPVHVGSVAG